MSPKMTASVAPATSKTVPITSFLVNLSPRRKGAMIAFAARVIA